MSAPVNAGDVLAGKYEVERVIGEGGMGIVVSAMHMQLGQRVAIKFLLPEALKNEEVRRRFEREAKAAVKIQSEHVARVIDVGTLENGSPYMIMEYLEGRDLAATIEERGSLPAHEAVGYVLQACEAVAEAHFHGIVHRDLKPANLFLAKRTDGRKIIKVLDFGISKSSVATADKGLTSTGSMMGSPYYMSPEQMMAAKSVDARTDIWAFGIILYELMTGQPPFLGETVAEVILAIANKEPASIRATRPEVPVDLEAVIMRCLRKSAGERFDNIADLAHALEPFAPQTQSRAADRITGVFAGGASQPPPTANFVVASARAPANAATALAPSSGLAQTGPGAPPASTPGVSPAMTAASWGTASGLVAERGSNRAKIVAIAGAALGLLGIIGIGFVALRPSAEVSAQNPRVEPAKATAPVEAPRTVAAPAAPTSEAQLVLPARNEPEAPVVPHNAGATSAPASAKIRAPRPTSHAAPPPAAPPAAPAAAVSAPAPAATPAPEKKNPLKFDLK